MADAYVQSLEFTVDRQEPDTFTVFTDIPQAACRLT
jgi:hypothetical protein